ncbi:MAG: methylenetetrahydrofolate--tRNA-(uracil(54)-C(5))-methyltransferase (FADH(2)-oxidizing) TrmFO [Nitrospirota bacterium]|nr:methylenetetrahydrofolate--tRNA-(uracil(54)-C(5))-methyltransferase (FADH(2)-oxidizing) TrmFO [Nitrospirota bacterium]
MPTPGATDLTVVGGGLAGSEAAWQAAEAGLRVTLYEMRPARPTEAHRGEGLAELVCSNSLKSDAPDTPAGELKAELRGLGSLILRAADAARVPAGKALAVDREVFSRSVTEAIQSHPRIRLVREEITGLPPAPAVIATGPLTAPALAEAIRAATGERGLYFYDAISPIVAADSVNLEVAFRASRYDAGDDPEGDYLNCPLDAEQYAGFIRDLLAARTVEAAAFEEPAIYFEGCMPIEVMAARGPETLAHGPMKPVGLTDPRTGRMPHAVVQLRQEDLARSYYNLVGFQTKLAWPEQERVLRTIPGLENAEFFRFGAIHRNTYVHSPTCLEPGLMLKGHPGIWLAGQITGVEGYLESTAMGLLAGLNAARWVQGIDSPLQVPEGTAIGALARYLTQGAERFQPMNINFGLFPPPAARVRSRAQRREAAIQRAREDFLAWRAGGMEWSGTQQQA